MALTTKLLNTEELAEHVDASRSDTERAQRAEAAKHTAPMCPKCQVQFSVCGCKPPKGS